MSLPGFKSSERQPHLPLADYSSDRDIDRPTVHSGHGRIRVLLGDFCEELTVQLLSSRKFSCRRFRTDSAHKYCPDIVVSPRESYSTQQATRSNGNTQHATYLEVKCMGRTNATLIYAGRLAKDMEFADTHLLYYCLYHHDLDTGILRTVLELQLAFLKHLQGIYLFPFNSILQAANDTPLTKLNSRYGHADTNPTTYGSGHRIPLRTLIQQPHERIDFNYVVDLF